MAAPVPYQPYRVPADEGPEVGDFRPGSPASQWALSRYLISRAVADYVNRSLYLVSLAVIVAGAVAWWGVSAWLGVPLVLIGFLALGFRALIAALLRGLFESSLAGADPRLRQLVSETRRDVRRELRRIGVPSTALTLPLLGMRLAGRNRQRTLARLRSFQLSRVVSPSRVDQLHLLLRDPDV